MPCLHPKARHGIHLIYKLRGRFITNVMKRPLSLFGNGIGQRCVAETTGIKKWNHSCVQSDSISVIVVREIL